MTEEQVDGAGGVPGGPGPEPSRDDEQAVRALLHRAVAEVQPAPDALARIRRAVPARRARYRQAWTGAAVIVALTAVAVPTLNGLGALQLSDGSAPGAAAQAGTEAARPGRGAEQHSSGPAMPVPVPGYGSPSAGGASATPTAAGQSASPSSSAPGPSAPAGATAPPSTVPACARTDLGGGTVTTGQADATGRVYGAFTVTNLSGHPCLLADPGAIGAVVSGGGGAVQVVPHTAGDPAPDLPPPAPDIPRLLATGAAYRMVFAWVPDAVCPSSGPVPQVTGSSQPSAAGASPSSAATAGAASGSGAQPGAGRAGMASPASGADGGTTAGASGQPAPPASPSATPAPSPAVTPGTLALTYRPLGAAPDAVSATIGGVCGGGTVYRAAVQ
jgi:hypothetical protein